MKRKIFLVALAVGIIYLLVGCVGSDQPYNPMYVRKCGNDENELVQPWWRTPYYARTPKDKNPWLAFVRDQPNEFDPWANDDIQRYSVAPIFTGVAHVSSAAVAPITSEEKARAKLEKALNKNLSDYLREHAEKQKREVY